MTEHNNNLNYIHKFFEFILQRLKAVLFKNGLLLMYLVKNKKYLTHL